MAFTGATAGLAAGAQTNDTRMDFALESTYATPPTGNYQALRITGETFGQAQTTARPEEINSLKEVSQDVITQVSASGTISGALSSGTFDDLIAGAMGADWNNITFTSSGNPSSSGSFIQWITAADVDNHKGYKFVSLPTNPPLVQLPATGLVLLNDPTNGINNVLVPYSKFSERNYGVYIPNSAYSLPGDRVAAAGATAVFSGITNGNIDKTFTIRKKLLNNFLMYPGSLITQVQFQLQQAQFGTVSIDATSANEIQSATDIAASILSAPSGTVHNSVNNFLGATIFGDAPEGCVTQFTCTLARDGAANDYGMGHADACGVRPGQFTASGSIEFYFRSWDEYNASLAGTQGPIIVKTVDNSGNGYAFAFLNGALRNGKVNSSQTNQTVKASFDIAGNPASQGGTFAIFRLTGVAATGS